MTHSHTSMPPPPSATAGTALPENANVELEIDGPTQQQRVTVFFRGLLLFPHYFVLFFRALAAMAVVFVGWFAALATGRLPGWAQQYLARYLSYTTRVNAYMYLLVDDYPPFSLDSGNYPVRIDLHSGPLNRAAVLFRFILIIPAMIVASVVGTGWMVCAFGLWLAVLITGRTPAPVFGATASILRYTVRLTAYYLMLTSAYPNPKSLIGEQIVDAEQQGIPRGTRPLALTKGAIGLLIAFLVLGAVGSIGNNMAQQSMMPKQPTATASR